LHAKNFFSFGPQVLEKMEAIFSFMVHARGVMPFMENPDLDMLFNILTIVAKSAQDAALTLLHAGRMSAQTRAELLGVLSLLTVALSRFDLADTLCRDLKDMQKLVKDLSSPAQHSPHAYIYTLLATVNELTGWIVVGDRTCYETLVGVLEATANELCFLVVTPMVKQTVLSLVANLKRLQPLPKNVVHAVNKVKSRIYRKKVRLQSAV
jgi:hypothetical protein